MSDENKNKKSLTDYIKNNPTLSTLNEIEKNRSKLLSEKYKKLSLPEYTMSKTFKEFNKQLKNPIISNAFLKNYAQEFEKSLALKNVTSLQKTIQDFHPSLKKEYLYAIKATNQFEETANKLKKLGIYNREMNKIPEYFKSKTPEGILKYASEINKANSSLSQSILKERLSTQNSIKYKIPKVEKFKINDNIIESSKISNEISILMHKKAQKKEKREIDIHENSKAQVEKLEIISEYMVQQSDLVKTQNEILSLQVENLKQQNELMSEQQEENKKTSKMALWVAIVSIIMGIITGIGSIYNDNKIYQLEDKSDNKNNSKLLNVIKNNKTSDELVPYLKKQMNETQKTNILLEKLLKKEPDKKETN